MQTGGAELEQLLATHQHEPISLQHRGLWCRGQYNGFEQTRSLFDKGCFYQFIL